MKIKNVFMAVVVGVALTACGDGGFERITTIAGVVAVDSPKGWPVVCFVEAHGGGIDCVSYSEMDVTQK